LVERGLILAEEGEAIDFPHLFTGDETLDMAAFRLSETGFLNSSSKTMSPDKTREDSLDAIQGFLDAATPLRDLETQMVLEALKRTTFTCPCQTGLRHLSISCAGSGMDMLKGFLYQARRRSAMIMC